MKRKGKQRQQAIAQRELPLLGERAAGFDPIALFDSWLNRQRPLFLDSTQTVYRSLWRRFIHDMASKKTPFWALTPYDIQEFLQHLEGVRRPQRERYQKVIERAYTEMSRQDPSAINPSCGQALQDPFKEKWRHAPDNEATQFLHIEQCRHLVQLLQARAVALAKPAGYTKARIWRESRDLCIVSVLLGCGLRPQELSHLQRRHCHFNAMPTTLNELSKETRQKIGQTEHWKLSVCSLSVEGDSKRCIAVPEWTQAILMLWLERAQLKNDDYLFPGRRHHDAQGPAPALNPATLARVVSKWGGQYADIVLTPQRLRNAFGACMLTLGLSLEELELLMGYAPGAASAWRLQSSWLQWCHQQAEKERND